jgi:hypothetical protein
MPGWNPLTGHDPTGARPAGSPYGYTVRTPNQPFIPRSGGPGQTFGIPTSLLSPYMTYTTNPATVPPPPHIQQQMYSYPPVTHGLVAPGVYAPQWSYTYQPNGAGNFLPRQAHQTPAIDPTVPALNFTNSSGGVGCEPGYNYWFSPANTKLHFFQTTTAPWHLPETAQIPFKALHVPVTVTFAELFRGTGCTNPTPKKNRVYEVISAGGGRWYKGLEVTGADKDMLKKPIRDVGWDETRTGLPNEKPAVCLWLCKD